MPTLISIIIERLLTVSTLEERREDSPFSEKNWRVASFLSYRFSNDISATTPIFFVSSKKGDARDDGMQHHQTFAAGSFVEFDEKKRTHIGKIDTVDYKSSGPARYQ